MNKTFSIKNGLVLIAFLFCGCGIAWGQSRAEYAVFYPPAKNGRPQRSVVIDLRGLQLRTGPSFQDSLVVTIPFAETVRSVPQRPDSTPDAGSKMTWSADSIPGFWEKIRWRGTSGYAFNAFLAPGILEMKEDFYLLMEDRGDCWFDAYPSVDYNFYAVFAHTDSLHRMLRRVKPVFYSHRGGRSAGVAVRSGARQPAQFLIVSKSPLAEGPFRWQKVDRPLFRRKQDRASGQFAIHAAEVPLSELVLEGSRVATPEGAMLEVLLRDKKTARTQTLLQVSEQADLPRLLWFGDLDGDALTDFMLSYGGKDGSTVYALFLSRGAAEGLLVRPAVSYTVRRCQ